MTFLPRASGARFQRAAIRDTLCRSLRDHGGGHGHYLLAFGQDARAAGARRGSLCPERNEPHPERALPEHFWLSYCFLCLAIPGPFSAMGPFWTIASETMPRNVLPLVVGLVNAFGNVGGYVGQEFVGWLSDLNHTTAAPFNVLGWACWLAPGWPFSCPRPSSGLLPPCRDRLQPRYWGKPETNKTTNPATRRPRAPPGGQAIRRHWQKQSPGSSNRASAHRPG